MDPDQLALQEARSSESTLFSKEGNYTQGALTRLKMVCQNYMYGIFPQTFLFIVSEDL